MLFQFTYNPEWFVEEDDNAEEDEWDLAKYRQETEAEREAEEERRIRELYGGDDGGTEAS